jgi:hypothetical protein
METGYAVESDQKQMSVPKKKIGFFKRWMLKSVKEAVDAERGQAVNLVGSQDIVSTKSLRIGRSESTIDQPERAIHFTVYTANGGRVVETRRYERKTDRHSNGLYVITNDQDFGREIDKIITQEALR